MVPPDPLGFIPDLLLPGRSLMFCQEAQSYLFQVSDSQGCKQPENLCCNPNMLERWLFSDFGLPALNTELQC